MSPRTSLLAFQAEKDLENYLLVHLSLLLSDLGQGLLIIGKQVATAFDRRIDLLAIDATGAIHVIELKLGGTTPQIVSQITDYLYWIRKLSRDDIIRVVTQNRLGINLKVAFQERFGHPLPAAVNEAQVLTIVAASIDLKTQRSILAIRNPGLSTTMFRYVVQSGAVSLIPCCLDGQDVEASQAETIPQALRKHSTAPVSLGPPTYRVLIHDSVREFWLTHAHLFASPIVTFEFVFKEYEKWVRAQVTEGRQPTSDQMGLFGRELFALTGESGEWTRVYFPPGIDVNTLATLTNLPLTRTVIGGVNYRAVAYRRNPDYQASAA